MTNPINLTDILTYSARKRFLTCPKSFWFRYVKGLVGQSTEGALFLGSIFHSALEEWFTNHNPLVVKAHIDAACIQRDQDDSIKQIWHYLTAMMRAYILRYREENFVVTGIEEEFEFPLTNPDTGRTSRHLILAGRVDLCLRMKEDETYWLMEHKSASQITSGYLDQLWQDPQIIGYCNALEQERGIKVEGILYDVVQKPSIRQHKGESEEEFNIRYAELCAKSKNGKSTAKRKIPESDEEFQNRLRLYYVENPSLLHRSEILLDRNMVAEMQRELWAFGQLYLHVRRTDRWLRNRHACYEYGRKCVYMPACNAITEDEFNQMIELYLEKKTPHQELTAGQTAMTESDGGIRATDNDDDVVEF